MRLFWGAVFAANAPLLCFGEGQQRPEQHGIDDGGDDCVRANSKRQGKNGGGRKAGWLPQHPQAEEHILPKGSHPETSNDFTLEDTLD